MMDYRLHRDLMSWAEANLPRESMIGVYTMPMGDAIRIIAERVGFRPISAEEPIQKLSHDMQTWWAAKKEQQ